MKTKKNALLTALLGVFLAFGLSPYSFALPARHATPQAQAQQQPPPAASQEFTGKIMQLKNGQLALITGKTDKGYSGHFLDDQNNAKKFMGKDVKVTGTLDTGTNTIHVTNIQGS
ncbi:MAG TPA: hypothetical protein VJP87_02665 [Candidatus Acidoferrales bacterium]|nr:hypothetical protein [Candidatus Acidoferrales bacterium]